MGHTQTAQGIQADVRATPNDRRMLAHGPTGRRLSDRAKEPDRLVPVSSRSALQLATDANTKIRWTSPAVDEDLVSDWPESKSPCACLGHTGVVV